MGNIIPQGSMYAPALAFMQYFPEPNLTGIEDNFITDQNLIRHHHCSRGEATLLDDAAHSCLLLNAEHHYVSTDKTKFRKFCDHPP